MITKALENGVRIYTDIILKNAVATVAVLSLITILLLQSALTFEENMTRDIEVYLPEGEESTEILIEVREDWATDLIIVYIETGNAKEPNIFPSVASINLAFVELNSFISVEILSVKIIPSLIPLSAG